MREITYNQLAIIVEDELEKLIGIQTINELVDRNSDEYDKGYIKGKIDILIKLKDEYDNSRVRREIQR